MSLDLDLRVMRRSFEVRAAFSLQPGERLALFGPSGAGKTSLLEAVAGLLAPSAGACLLDGEPLSRPPGRTKRSTPPARHRGAVGRVSIVRQPTSLFPHLDVAANIAYGRSEPQLAAGLASALGLDQLLGAYPASLSGGQAQRVALARALARHFRVLLLDEPMAAMDAATTALCWEVVRSRCEEEQAVALLVTHDLPEAQAFGDRLAVMDEGEILQLGDPHQVVSAPASRRTAEVLGYDSFVTLRRLGAKSGPPGRGRTLELAIDPSRVRLGSHPGLGAIFRGTVTSCIPYRAGFRLQIRLDDNSPVELGGTLWSLSGPARLTLDVDGGATMGNELLATAVAPPAVGHANRDTEDML
jgi:ABC-type sulfate/molybdate transport systems ATPase subunit